ncbi:MAG: hypothetical protein Q8R47_03890 [Nanoarchaeota archaeon]|nr:hypothetical protein [Nanoarchaeota archaeon]
MITGLFISIGYQNNLFGKHKLSIPLPPDADFATLKAVGYFIIGNIQKQHPSYFKNNIESYTKGISKVFGQEIKPIVE